MTQPVTPTLLPGHSPAELGLVCPGCGAAEFKTRCQEFRDGTRHVRADCARCGKFVRYLKQPGGPDFKLERYRPDPDQPDHPAHEPPPESWRWVGFIRQADRVWRPVAEAPTLGRCWDALLHYPGDGDRLCVPTRPGKATKGEEEGDDEHDDTNSGDRHLAPPAPAGTLDPAGRGAQP
jgi:hypothetical protein